MFRGQDGDDREGNAWNMSDHTISGVWVARPFWRRGSGLAYASMPLINNNPYPV
jgi:hypothetical protein